MEVEQVSPLQETIILPSLEPMIMSATYNTSNGKLTLTGKNLPTNPATWDFRDLAIYGDGLTNHQALTAHNSDGGTDTNEYEGSYYGI